MPRKGYKQTEEHKRNANSLERNKKIRETLIAKGIKPPSSKGKHRTEKEKLYLSNFWKGKPKPWLKNKKISDEHRKKISIRARERNLLLIGMEKRPSDYQKTFLRKLRKSVTEAFGGKCIKCGFSDERALQIDHINGGGGKERKERKYKGSFHSHVLKSFLAHENKYQLLCANCNWIKRYENNEIKGKNEKT